MQEAKPIWTYSEFVTFLLIYAAHADVELTDKEYEFIKSYSNVDTYHKMMVLFEDMSEFEVLETLKSYKKHHYPNQEAKDKIMAIMNEFFYIDGDYSSMEKTLNTFLNYLL